jgi:hypothetical protein
MTGCEKPRPRRRKLRVLLTVGLFVSVLVLLGWAATVHVLSALWERSWREDRTRSSQEYLEQQIARMNQGGPGSGYVDLYEARGVDDLMPRLDGMAEVQALFLEGTDITDASLPIIARLPNLESLSIQRGNPGVTDDGLAALKGHSKLTDLVIQTRPTNNGFAALKELPALHSLTIMGSPHRWPERTEASLIHLKELKQLEKLVLYADWLSPSGEAELRQALPRCEIRVERRR